MLSSWIAGMDGAGVCKTIYASRPVCGKVSAQPACRASACVSVRWLYGQVLGCLQVNSVRPTRTNRESTAGC